MPAALRVLLAAAVLAPIQALAQVPPSSPVPAPAAPAPLTQVAVVDLERLFNQSKFGTWVREERNAALLALVRENEAYDEQFSGEESELAEIKPSLGEIEFGQLAEDFDERVNSRREIQDQKGEKILDWVSQQENFFLNIVAEVMPIIARQFGLRLVVDSNAVAWHHEAIDLTPVLRSAIDNALANGAAIENIRPAWEFAGVGEAYLE